jgi:hypothetical protein
MSAAIMLTLQKPTTPQSTPAGTPDTALEQALDLVEAQLSALGAALVQRDTLAIDRHSADLHSALAKAVDCFARAAKSGPLPPALRRRLVSASGQVAAQRESLARATAALDRAIDVLIPNEGPRGYSAYGKSTRSGGHGGSFF